MNIIAMNIIMNIIIIMTIIMNITIANIIMNIIVMNVIIMSFIMNITVMNIIVFIHFYSASHSMSLSEALPTTAIDIVSEFTCRSAIGNCK